MQSEEAKDEDFKRLLPCPFCGGGITEFHDICTYDNPATMARECWQDGQLVCKYDASMLFRKLPPWGTQPVPPDRFFFGANIGDWNIGQLVGDASAMLNVPLETTVIPNGESI